MHSQATLSLHRRFPQRSIDFTLHFADASRFEQVTLRLCCRYGCQWDRWIQHHSVRTGSKSESSSLCSCYSTWTSTIIYTSLMFGEGGTYEEIKGTRVYKISTKPWISPTWWRTERRFSHFTLGTLFNITSCQLVKCSLLSEHGTTIQISSLEWEGRRF